VSDDAIGSGAFMTGAGCAWPGCGREIPRSRLMCKEHWYSVPEALRNQIWAYYRPGQTLLTCTAQYREALCDVMSYAIEHASDGAS